MTICDFDFESGDRAVFHFVTKTGDDGHAIVHVHEAVMLEGQKAYIVSAPARLLREAFVAPDFFEGFTVPEGWWMVLVDPEELSPASRMIRVI